MGRFQAYEDSQDHLAPDEWELEALTHDQFDDRRAIERAFDAWADMLRARACPSIEDMEPLGVAGPRDVLIDLRSDPDDPDLTCIGGALVAECGARGLKRLSEAPAGSLLALLAAHYRYAASTRRPIAFEGERGQADGRSGTYRAILLPLSSDGESVDFVHGRISWRDLAAHALSETISAEMNRPQLAAGASASASPWPTRSSERVSAAE